MWDGNVAYRSHGNLRSAAMLVYLITAGVYMPSRIYKGTVFKDARLSFRMQHSR